MDYLLELFHSENDDDILDFDLKMLQAWLVVAPSSKIYTIYTVFFHKYGGSNVAITNCMSHFYMFVKSKSTVKLANKNAGDSQVIGIILCCFTNCPILYLMGPVYYCPGHPSNTISLCVLKFYVGFKNITSEPLEHCHFVYPQGCSWTSFTRLKTIETIFK